MRRILVLLLFLLLVACEAAPTGPKAVSLDEARRVAVDRSAATTVPRSIEDVAEILDRERPDPAIVAEDRAKADAQPAPGLAGERLGAFYLERARAARLVGRSAQVLADARQALKLYDGAGVISSRTIQVLALYEWRAGNVRTAMELYERLAKPDSVPGISLSAMHLLVATAGMAGDFAAAERWAEQAERLRAQLRNNRRAPEWAQRGWDGHAALARARYANATGHAKEADEAFAQAIAANDRAIELYSGQEKPDAPTKTELQLLGQSMRKIRTNFYVNHGRLLEAESLAREQVAGRLKLQGASVETADALQTFALVLMEEGRLKDAERIAQAAIRMLDQIGVDPESSVRAGLQLVLSDLLVLQGRDAEALALFDQVERSTRGDPTARLWLMRNRTLSMMAMYRAGRVDPALQIARRLDQQRNEIFGAEAPETAEARGFVAVGLAAKGDRSQALETMRRAIPTLLRTSGGDSMDEDSGSEATPASAQRLRFLFERYIDLLLDSGAPDAAVQAFPAADAMRLRSVNKAIVAAAARGVSDNPEVAALVRDEQDLSMRLAAAQSVLASSASVSSEQRDASALAKLRAEVKEMAAARATLRDTIARRAPAYADLAQPRAAEVAAVRERLAPGEAMVMIVEGPRRGYVWAFRREGPVAFAPVPFSADEMRRAVADLRRPMEAPITTLNDIAPFDTALAYRLYAALLKPVESGWHGADTLVIVGDRDLAALPFGMLLTEQASPKPEREGEALFAQYRTMPWLIRKVAIAQSPSASSFVALRATHAVAGERRPFVGFADPAFSPGGAQVADATTMRSGAALHRRAAPATSTMLTARLGNLPRLPDTAIEVKEIARALEADPRADTFVGAAASEQQVRSMRLDDRRVVMFATHGLRPGELDGLLEPALALSAPAAGGNGDDGLLTASKILGLRLNADWVVLSACNTGAGSGEGAEALSGLARAFFYAGSRAVVATNWSVETVSAKTLTVSLFRDQAAHAGEPRARALQSAMTALIDGGPMDNSGRRVFSYAHPLFWAPFGLIGDGGK